MIPDSFEPYLDTITASTPVWSSVVGVALIICGSVAIAIIFAAGTRSVALQLVVLVAGVAMLFGGGVTAFVPHHNATIVALGNPVLSQSDNDDRPRWHVTGNVTEVSTSSPGGLSRPAETTLQLGNAPDVWLLVRHLHLRTPSTGLELDLVCMATTDYAGIDFLCQEGTAS